MNLADLLGAQASRLPAQTALLFPGGIVTYGALAERAGGIAARLQAAGVVPGDRIAVLAQRGPDCAAAYFGILATGAAAVLIDRAFKRNQIEHVIRHSGARLLLAQPWLAVDHALRPDDTIPIVYLEERAEPGQLRPVVRAPNDLAQIIYTSGSIGLAKGVAVSHANLLDATRLISGYLGLCETDRIASVLPFSFVYGLSQLLSAVRVGASLIVLDASLPADMVEALRRERVTVLAGVPLLWHQWLATPAFREQPLEELRIVTNAGGGISAETALGLRRTQPQARLFLMYGLTEAIRSTFLPPEELERRPGSIGRAMPETEIFLLRDDGTDCGVDEVGEVVQAGPTVTLGYWQDAVATARVFRPHPRGGKGLAVHTGDLARRDAEGFLYFVGRRDRQVKSLSYRVHPEELELALRDSGLATASAVIAVPDSKWGYALVAHIVLAPGATDADIRRHCTKELPSYLQPKRIEVWEHLPRLPSGKADLALLAVPRD